MKRIRGRELAELRAWWLPLVSQGRVKCWRCRVELGADEPFDLGHPLDLALGGHPRAMVPEHRHGTSTCVGNRSAGAQLGQQLRRAPRRQLAAWLR